MLSKEHGGPRSLQQSPFSSFTFISLHVENLENTKLPTQRDFVLKWFFKSPEFSKQTLSRSSRNQPFVFFPALVRHVFFINHFFRKVVIYSIGENIFSDVEFVDKFLRVTIHWYCFSAKIFPRVENHINHSKMESSFCTWTFAQYTNQILEWEQINNFGLLITTLSA